MYKQIRDVVVAFFIWFVLTYIVTATSISFLLWHNFYDINEWDFPIRVTYGMVFILIGVLVKLMRK